MNARTQPRPTTRRDLAIAAALGLVYLLVSGWLGRESSVDPSENVPRPVPASMQAYVGTWSSPPRTISLGSDGQLRSTFETATMRFARESAGRSYTPDLITTHEGADELQYRIDVRPHVADDGRIHITIDGRDYTRIAPEVRR